MLGGRQLSPSISNTCSHITTTVERGRIELDLAVHDCEPTDHGIPVLCHLCWSLIEEVPTELTVDLAFLIGVVINILNFLHQNVAWVDVPACSFLSFVSTDVVHYEADDFLTLSQPSIHSGQTGNPNLLNGSFGLRSRVLGPLYLPTVEINLT